MAVTVALVNEGPGFQVWDITATADADDNIPLPHGKSSAPYFVIIDSRQLGLSRWNWTTNPKGFVICAKGVNPGSGAAGVQCTATLLWPQRLAN